MAKSKTREHDAGQGARARIEQACQQAVAGKFAVRQLTSWVAGAGVDEAEFRVLWQLLSVADDLPTQTLDQAELAERLAASPAQISAVVERLRRRDLAECETHPSDRRRQLWRPTAAGRALVVQIIAAVDALSPDVLSSDVARRYAA